MSIKNNFYYINVVIFAFFFFFWGIRYSDFEHLIGISNFFFLDYKLSFIVTILLVPIFFTLLKKKKYLLNDIFDKQKKIKYLVFFIIFHFFLTKVIFNDEIDRSEIFNISYLICLAIIYCHYRNFIHENFSKILLFYLACFVFFSIFSQNQTYNHGQCDNDFIFNLFNNHLGISLTNSIYLENSHLAMMMVPVFFSSLIILEKNTKPKNIFLFLLIISMVILLNNLSTSFFMVYFVSQIFLLIFFYMKINIKFWIVSIVVLLLNSFIFFSNNNCTIKITDFDSQDILNKKLDKTSPDIRNNKNTTTLIYERSIIIAIETLNNRILGWGIDGLDNATNDFINRPEYKNAYILAKQLNMKDGLSNSLKIISEFGIFSLFLIYLFFNYILYLKKINSYNIFIIILFITMCIRSAGYFNGGFIFCIFEFLYLGKINSKLKKNKSI